MAKNNFTLPHEFGLICRDLGYEVGAALKPKSEAEIMLALCDIQTLARELKENSKNVALNGFLIGVIAALENTAQESGK